MSFQTYLKDKTKSELTKLKQMSWKDRAWYIIEYYKYHMIIIFMLLCFLYVIASSIYRQTFNDVLYCATINNYGYSDMNTEYFREDFHEYAGFGPKDLITIDTSLMVNYSNSAPLSDEEFDAKFEEDLNSQETLAFSANASMNGEAEYASLMKLTALVTAKALDVVIIDEKNMEGFSFQSMAGNMQTMLPEDLFQSLSEEDRVVYGTKEDGTTYPCGIRLAGTNAETIGRIHIEEPIFTILPNTQNPETSVLFLQYLLGKSITHHLGSNEP